jgi:Ca2+-binding EF-hand superfamily protein
MPAYNENRWAALYFVSFMMISFFFLMNLILAIIVEQYDKAVAERKQDRKKNSEDCLTKAYQLLDPQGSGHIEKEIVMALFVILNEDFPEFRKLSDDDTALIYAFLDKDGSSEISKEEFMDISSVLFLEFVKQSDYASWVERAFPKFANSERYQGFCSAVKSERFENAIDLILILNAFVVAIQSYPELSGNRVEVDPKSFDGSIDTPWEIVESVFTAIYCLEVAVKVSVFGWKVNLAGMSVR